MSTLTRVISRVHMPTGILALIRVVISILTLTIYLASSSAIGPDWATDTLACSLSGIVWSKEVATLLIMGKHAEYGDCTHSNISAEANCSVTHMKW